MPQNSTEWGKGSELPYVHCLWQWIGIFKGNIIFWITVSSLFVGKIDFGSPRVTWIFCNRSREWECSDAQSCLTLWDPMDYSPPGSSVLSMGFSWQEYWSEVALGRGVIKTVLKTLTQRDVNRNLIINKSGFTVMLKD